MTLLAFDIRVASQSSETLATALLALTPTLGSYLISFVLLGVYWVGHRNQFAFIERTDHHLHWLNIFFLAFVALIPFTTETLSRHPADSAAILLYGLNLIVIGVILCGHWLYAVRAGLLREGISRAVVVTGVRRCLLAPCGYLLAMALSFMWPGIGLLLYAVIPLLYIFPTLGNIIWPVPTEN